MEKETKVKSKETTKKKTKKKYFWKIYWAFVAVGIVAITAVLIVLNAFLISYEKAQPNHLMDEVLVWFQNKDMDSILTYETTPYDAADVDQIKEALTLKTEGKELSYNIDYSKNSADIPVYNIYADRQVVATVYLAENAKRESFNSKRWHVSQVTDVVQKLDDITISAPSSYTVKVNGKALDDSYITGTAELADKEHYGDYASTSFPETSLYQVGNLYVEPEVECLDQDGNTVDLYEGEFPTYVYGLNHTTFPEEKRDDLNTFIRHYVNYCMSDEKFGSVKGYFVDGTSTYSRMYEVEEIAVYSGIHERIDISDVEVSDYVVYNEDAYKATYEFTYTIIHGVMSRENPTILNCYYVKIDGQWKILEMTINANREG